MKVNQYPFAKSVDVCAPSGAYFPRSAMANPPKTPAKNREADSLPFTRADFNKMLGRAVTTPGRSPACFKIKVKIRFPWSLLLYRNEYSFK